LSKWASQVIQMLALTSALVNKLLKVGNISVYLPSVQSYPKLPAIFNVCCVPQCKRICTKLLTEI